MRFPLPRPRQLVVLLLALPAVVATTSAQEGARSAPDEPLPPPASAVPS